MVEAGVREQFTVMVALAGADRRSLDTAAAIGGELAGQGLRPLLVRAGDADTLAGVAGVVLVGAWGRPWARAAASRFLHRHATVLRVRPLWMVDAAPAGDGHPHPVPAPDLELPVRLHTARTHGGRERAVGPAAAAVSR
ncbi:hypothetical protein [Pseudonocardia sp. McavD-2-B]|uniref:hypothetical protein n=1 Tax=Pseudonocardia sp. McavD-2-B TaxID=2954499 RepID=UPI002096D040|nr:hypothetical protein [Pseudonocardia sp. McavD-2-B]MCO7192982.1 hypothetical protein [Pseudonocardia sp. McavD-2-B]